MNINKNYSHIDVCKLALIDENVFNTFKNNQDYKIILEHVSHGTGLEYLEKIKKSKYFNTLAWEKFLENDKIGNPTTFNYSLTENYNINISPTTLRYVSIGLDIIDHIQNNKLGDINIVEIGGGYSGQCKILFDLCKPIEIKIKKYTIIDIPEVSKFQEKYLNCVLDAKVNNIFFKSCLGFDIEDYDLCVSNYALGEFDKDVRDEYVEKVVKHSKHYFIIWNNYGYDEYFNDATVLPEIPMTWEQNKLLLK